MMLLKKWISKCLAWANYYYKTTSIFHQPAKTVIQPSYVVAFTPAETHFLTRCAHSFNYQVDYSLGFRQKEVFAVPLQAITFLGNSGAVVLKDKVVVESVFDSMRLVKSPAFRRLAWMAPRVKKQGVYTTILHLPWAANSNYHWFLDCLPRLYALSVLAPDQSVQVIVPDTLPSYQLETLRFITKEKKNISVVTIGAHKKWQIAHFLFLSFVSNHNSGYLPVPILDNLRAKIWQGYQIADYREKKRLFISRSKATKRRVLNEDALLQLLVPYGFEVVRAEDLSYQQQVQLFYGAAWVMAPHGAGLTNILFSKQCDVWELHPADIIKSHYFMLCKALQFTYHYSIGTQSNGNLDFTIDEDTFARQLQQVFTPDTMPN